MQRINVVTWNSQFFEQKFENGVLQTWKSRLQTMSKQTKEREKYEEQRNKTEKYQNILSAAEMVRF